MGPVVGTTGTHMPMIPIPTKNSPKTRSTNLRARFRTIPDSIGKQFRPSG